MKSIWNFDSCRRSRFTTRSSVSAWTKILAAAAIACGLALGEVHGAGLTGAIFTTDSTGSLVNGNIYPSKDAVYLNGGPQAQIGAAGLPDGFYYVKITEPNGTLLGTSIPAAPIQVVNGVFVVRYQLSAIAPYADTTNPGGEYKVWVSRDVNFTNSQSKTDNFKVLASIPPPPPQGLLIVQKFYDANANGIFDNGEVILENWKVNVNDGATNVDRFTTLSEFFAPGNYNVSEYMPIETGWVATTPTTVAVTIADQGSASVLFGNLCLGDGGGKTLGFWSNKNGQAKLNDGGSMASELALLREAFLRNADGSHFNPTTYDQLRNWLLSGTATNMAYMLSVQMAAMKLNIEAGFVDEDSILYAPGTNSANSLGYATLSDLLTEANTLLGTGSGVPDNGPNLLILSGNSFRTRAEALKNAFDLANNNKNFVHPDPCDYSF